MCSFFRVQVSDVPNNIPDALRLEYEAAVMIFRKSILSCREGAISLIRFLRPFCIHGRCVNFMGWN